MHKEKQRRQKQKMTHRHKPQRKPLHQLDSQFWEDLRTNQSRRYSDLTMTMEGEGSGVASTMSISTVCVLFCLQVHRVLPQWLAQPDMIHRDIKSNLVPFSDIPGLSSQLVKKLQNNGIQHLFPGNDTTSSYSVCSKTSEFWKWFIWTIMSSRLEIYAWILISSLKNNCLQHNLQGSHGFLDSWTFLNLRQRNQVLVLCKDRNLSWFCLHVCCGTIGKYTLKIYCDFCDSFTVQAEVIPAILESTQQGLLIGRGGYKPRDICVSAPTGSGKTLAFVIPVIQVSCLTSLSRHAYNMYSLYRMCKNEKIRWRE